MNSIQPREISGRRMVTRDGRRMLVVELDGTTGSVRIARRAAADFLTEPVPARSASRVATAWAGHGRDDAARGDAAQPGDDVDESAALPDTVVSDVLLVVAELVANACRHAPGPCRLTLTLAEESADVAVRDTGRGHLRIIRHDTPAGYGLLIVARLTSGIHVLPSGGGKIVRASVPLAGPRPTLV